MARNWKDVRAEANLDEAEVATYRQRLDEEARAYRPPGRIRSGGQSWRPKDDE